MPHKIILFAFRKSHKIFFKNFVKNIRNSNNFNISSTKDVIFPSLSGIKDLNKVNLEPACNFATDELYAKTGSKIFIPRFIIKSFFKFFSYINYFRYYRILDNNYNRMLIWNGGKFRQRIAIEIARIKNIEVFYFENGLLPNRLVLDNKGINNNNSIPKNKSFYQKYKNKLELPIKLTPRVGKNIQKFSGNKKKLPSKYIFVPFQVDYDTQIITHSHWIKNMRELFYLIENIAE